MNIRNVGIIGGGLTGKSIAQKIASEGIDVVVVEVSAQRAEQARLELVATLDRELEKWGITTTDKKVIMSRVEFVDDMERVARADLLIESVPDKLETKRKVMSRLGEICPEDRIFISNISTISITEIAAASGRPDKCVGMRFIYPVTRSPLLEVVRGMETSDESFATAREFAGLLGKECIEVFESPGYVTTRAILPFLNEAMHLVMEGVASATDVDKALRLGYEFKMGPLEYSDRVGLHTVMTWMDHLFREMGDLKFRPCPLLRKLVRAGHLGRRTGRGFFSYDDHGRRIDEEVAR